MSTEPTQLHFGLKTAITKYEYNDWTNNPGQVTNVIPPRGNTGATPDYSYDITVEYYGPADPATKRGLPKVVRDALGNATSFDFDAVAHLTKTTDALNKD